MAGNQNLKIRVCLTSDGRQDRGQVHRSASRQQYGNLRRHCRRATQILRQMQLISVITHRHPALCLRSRIPFEPRRHSIRLAKESLQIGVDGFDSRVRVESMKYDTRRCKFSQPMPDGATCCQPGKIDMFDLANRRHGGGIQWRASRDSREGLIVSEKSERTVPSLRQPRFEPLLPSIKPTERIVQAEVDSSLLSLIHISEPTRQ